MASVRLLALSLSSSELTWNLPVRSEMLSWRAICLFAMILARLMLTACRHKDEAIMGHSAMKQGQPVVGTDNYLHLAADKKKKSLKQGEDEKKAIE